MKELLEKFLIRSPDTAFSTVDRNAVIVDLENSLINVLNPVGSRIWELADGSGRLGEIIAGILSEFDVEQKQAKKDAIEFVQVLASKQLMLLYDTSSGEGEMKITISKNNPYEKPMIIYRSKMQTRAGFCSGGNPSNKQTSEGGCTALWS